MVCIHTHTHTHTHSGILPSHQEKNEILTFATTWIELERITLSEISQSKKDKYDFTHMWNLRNKQAKGKKREKPRNRLLTIENKLMVIIGEVGRGIGKIGDGD